MPTAQEVFESLDGVRKNFDNPETREKFKGFNKQMQFKFRDLGTAYVLGISDNASATLTEGTIEKPDIIVETDSATFLGIRSKTISATQAYMAGKVKVKGSMPDLLKLQKLL